MSAVFGHFFWIRLGTSHSLSDIREPTKVVSTISECRYVRLNALNVSRIPRPRFIAPLFVCIKYMKSKPRHSVQCSLIILNPAVPCTISLLVISHLSIRPSVCLSKRQKTNVQFRDQTLLCEHTHS